MSCRGHHCNAENYLEKHLLRILLPILSSLRRQSAEVFLSFALMRGDYKDQIKIWLFFLHFLNICTRNFLRFLRKLRRETQCDVTTVFRTSI